MAEGANVIINALTTGATAVASSFVSLIGSLVESPTMIGLIGIGLAFGILKFALHRLPGVR